MCVCVCVCVISLFLYLSMYIYIYKSVRSTESVLNQFLLSQIFPEDPVNDTLADWSDSSQGIEHFYV